MFPLPWREGIEGRGRDFYTFYEAVIKSSGKIAGYSLRK